MVFDDSSEGVFGDFEEDVVDVGGDVREGDFSVRGFAPDLDDDVRRLSKRPFDGHSGIGGSLLCNVLGVEFRLDDSHMPWNFVGTESKVLLDEDSNSDPGGEESVQKPTHVPVHLLWQRIPWPKVELLPKLKHTLCCSNQRRVVTVVHLL